MRNTTHQRRDEQPLPGYLLDRPQIPSYARSTASSRSRSLPDRSVDCSSNLSTSPRRTLPHRDFKTCHLSTEASRRRSRIQGRFRFMDLPAEVRNMVYEYMFPPEVQDLWYRYEPSPAEQFVRYASKTARRTALEDMAGHHPRLRSSPLPALFLVPNKQVRFEFGSYIFNHRNLVFAGMRMREFPDLLRLIGYANCKRLVENQGLATLQLWRKQTPPYGPLMVVHDDFRITWALLSRLVDIDTLRGYDAAEASDAEKDRPTSPNLDLIKERCNLKIF